MSNIKQSPTAGTIARTIILMLALANQIFAFVGFPALNINESTMYDLCSLIYTIGAAGIAWWKNNSFSAAALRGDMVKDGVVSDAEDFDDPDLITDDTDPDGHYMD